MLKIKLVHDYHVFVSKNRETPQMDGENKGRALFVMDDLAGKPHYFWKTPTCVRKGPSWRTIFRFCLLDEVSTPLSLSTSDTPCPLALRMVRVCWLGGVKKAVMCFNWYDFLYPEVYVHLFLFSWFFFCNNMYDAYITWSKFCTQIGSEVPNFQDIHPSSSWGSTLHFLCTTPQPAFSSVATPVRQGAITWWGQPTPPDQREPKKFKQLCW